MCDECFMSLVLSLSLVFSMGNNAYGQCGRKIVEDEVYRFVLQQHMSNILETTSHYELLLSLDASSLELSTVHNFDMLYFVICLE